MLITVLLMTAALTGSDQDGVVATAPATSVNLEATERPAAPSVEGAAQAAAPHGLTTDEQIQRWMAARNPDALPYADAGPALPSDDRQMHGVVDVGFGTEGYRSYGAAVSMPIGENGRLDLSFSQVENGYPYGCGYGFGDPYMDYGGYAFPGYRPTAAAEFEARVGRQDGPPSRRPGLKPLQADQD